MTIILHGKSTTNPFLQKLKPNTSAEIALEKPNLSIIYVICFINRAFSNELADSLSLE